MLRSTLVLLVCFLISFVAAAAVDNNKPVVVDLLVRDNTTGKTFFRGPMITRGHDVTTKSGGTHKCDGTNNGMYKKPGATPTGALDTASKIILTRIKSWDGVWYPLPQYWDDYAVTQINGVPKAGSNDTYWELLVNGEHPTVNGQEVGGCQFQVKNGDRVTWQHVQL